jgi:hypothetical protein
LCQQINKDSSPATLEILIWIIKAELEEKESRTPVDTMNSEYPTLVFGWPVS